MKPLRVLLTLVLFSGIAFAFGLFLRTGNSALRPTKLLQDHPHLVLTEDFGDRILIRWKAAATASSGMILFDTISHQGDASKYAFSAQAFTANELSAFPGETKAARSRNIPWHTQKFIVALEGLNELTAYYFVLKNNNEVSGEYQFITPAGNIAANHAH
jgi:hypothetical protein